MRIREEDRHLTTFYTKWGRHRYRSVPQGYQASGDDYIHRYNKTTLGVKDVKRVIDESGKYSLSDRKLFDSVSSIKRQQQQQGGHGKAAEVNPPKATPKQCNICGTKHVEFRSWGEMPSLQH